MHIHLPKPLHGWREFLGEVGVIVLGVVIAIGLEQAVEELHSKSEVRSAQIAIREEMSHADRSFAYRAAARPCIERRLDEIEEVVERAAKRQPLPHVGQVIPDIGNALNDNVWQTYRASQTLAHFGDDELSRFGLYYLQMANIRNFMGDEVKDWGVLKIVQGDPARLGPVDIAGLRVAIQHARFENWIIAGIAADELDYSKGLGVTARPPDPGRVSEVCTPLPTRKVAAGAA